MKNAVSVAPIGVDVQCTEGAPKTWSRHEACTANMVCCMHDFNSRNFAKSLSFDSSDS